MASPRSSASGAPSSAGRPSRNTTRRSATGASQSASSLATTTPAPRAASARRSRASSARPAPPSAEAGSSRSQRSGASASIAASTVRWSSPPERVAGSRSARCAMPSAASAPSTAARIRSMGQPRLAGAKATSCHAVSAMPLSWVAGEDSTSATRPASAPCAAVSDGSAPSNSTDPSRSPPVCRGASPDATRRAVLVPAPSAPVNQVTRPASISSEQSRSAGNATPG